MDPPISHTKPRSYPKWPQPSITHSICTTSKTTSHQTKTTQTRDHVYVHPSPPTPHLTLLTWECHPDRDIITHKPTQIYPPLAHTHNIKTFTPKTTTIKVCAHINIKGNEEANKLANTRYIAVHISQNPFPTYQTRGPLLAGRPTSQPTIPPTSTQHGGSIGGDCWVESVKNHSVSKSNRSHVVIFRMFPYRIEAYSTEPPKNGR